MTQYMQSPDGAVFLTLNPEYYPESTNLGSGAKAKEAYRLYVVDALKYELKDQKVLYTILRSTSASGMTRSLSVVAASGSEHIQRLDYKVSIVLGLPIKDSCEGVSIKGCGQDMGHHLVSSLGYALFKDSGYFKQYWL